MITLGIFEWKFPHLQKKLRTWREKNHPRINLGMGAFTLATGVGLMILEKRQGDKRRGDIGSRHT